MKTIPHCIAANEAKRETISLGHAAPSKASLGFRPAQSEQETGEIYYAGPHLLTVAPTGAGKGRSFLIPTLLTSPSQIIAVDVKGELYQTTHRRRREMGHQVIKLDPFRVMGPATDAFNPCECINLPNGDIGADCQTLASLLASGMKFSRDPFWDNSACGFVSGLLAYVTACEPVHQQTIPRLRDLLHQDDVVYNTAVLLDTKGKIMPRFAYQELASFLQHAERETRPSVLSTAAGYLKPFMSDRVAEDGVATEQKTAPDDSIHHVDDRNFVRAKNLHARSTSHRKAPDANPNQRLKIKSGDSSKPACRQKCCVPAGCPSSKGKTVC